MRHFGVLLILGIGSTFVYGTLATFSPVVGVVLVMYGCPAVLLASALGAAYCESISRK